MTMRTDQSQLSEGFRVWMTARRYPLAPYLPGGLASLRRCPRYPRNWAWYAIPATFWLGFIAHAWLR